MKLNSVFKQLVVILALAFSAIALGQDREEFADNIQAYLERLELTDEQSEQLKEALQWQREARREILESHGFEANAGRNDNFKAMRAARGDLKELRRDVDERLSGFLSPVQMTEFHDLQKELKSGFKDKLKEKRKERSQ